MRALSTVFDEVGEDVRDACRCKAGTVPGSSFTGRAQHGELLLVGKGIAANDGTGGLLLLFNDFLGRFVYEVVVVRLQLNANFLFIGF
jgi:hypothetical protein